MSSLAAGMLLVATPVPGDPNFDGTVVLLLDVTPPGGPADPDGLGVAGDDGGAVGVVLNRPSGVPVSQVLGPWAGVVGEPEVVHQGGPVGTDGAIAVARLGPGSDVPVGFRPLGGHDAPETLQRLGVLDLDTPVELVRDGLSALRIFAGYAGWGSGQLERELARGSWWVVPGEVADTFCTDAAGLWRAVLRRQPGELAWRSTRPADPGLN